jgi:hypothetical protein
MVDFSCASGQEVRWFGPCDLSPARNKYNTRNAALPVIYGLRGAKLSYLVYDNYLSSFQSGADVRVVTRKFDPRNIKNVLELCMYGDCG